MVSQKWEECDLVPDDLRGWEGSKEVLPKENIEWRHVWPISRHNFFIDKLRGLTFDSKSLGSLFWIVDQRACKTSWDDDHSHVVRNESELIGCYGDQPEISQQLFKDMLLGEKKVFRSDVQKHYIWEALNMK